LAHCRRMIEPVPRGYRWSDILSNESLPRIKTLLTQENA
jgi:hypothetical protein